MEEVRGDVKVVVINGNMYYVGIEALLPVASCTASGREGVRRVGFVEKCLDLSGDGVVLCGVDGVCLAGFTGFPGACGWGTLALW